MSLNIDDLNMSGLSEDEVVSREAAGLVNKDCSLATKTIPEIVSQHFFTLFNFVNLALGLLVFTTGQWRNLMFLVIVSLNLVIGIFQEIRSKLAIDKLSILAQSDVKVIRDSKIVLIATDALVKDDVIILSSGQQIPADIEVLEGEARLNESLLTGESNPIVKRCGDSLLSGSYIEAGCVVGRVVGVGDCSYASKINSEAKYLKAPVSEIMSTTKGIIKFATTALVPLGIFLFLRTYLKVGDYSSAILSVVAAVISMIPQGLVLLTSSVMTIASTRLAQKNVLIQQIYCVETLARVDTLCLDKTGTITTGKMEVVDIKPYKDIDKSYFLEIVASILSSQKNDANQTARAIIEYVESLSIDPLEISSSVAFDSEKKYSGVTLKDGSSYVLGAASYVLASKVDEIDYLKKDCKDYERVLCVARVDGFENSTIKGESYPLGIIVLEDEIRSSARETISFFKKQNVEIKIISGDDPATVSAIALRVGVLGADKYVDMTNVNTQQEIDELVEKYNVFGRVRPRQKKMLILALKSKGLCVGMTGDGVNDVLALKEADVSIAFASGSEAARNISEVVLVDDDFSHIPNVVYEGRRSINNLQRSASLFLVKTVYSIILSFICIFMPPYPFIPIQMSLLSGLIIGLPSFVLALEPNFEKVKGDYLVNVLTRSLPASFTIILLTCFTVFIYKGVGWSYAEASTICTVLTSVIGVALIYRLSQPFTKMRKVLMFFVILFLLGGFFVFGEFFRISDLTWPTWGYVYLQTAIGLYIFNFVSDVALAHIDEATKFYKFLVKHLGVTKSKKPKSL